MSPAGWRGRRRAALCRAALAPIELAIALSVLLWRLMPATLIVIFLLLLISAAGIEIR